MGRGRDERREKILVSNFNGYNINNGGEFFEGRAKARRGRHEGSREAYNNGDGSKSRKEHRGEEALLDFVWAHKDLIDKETSDRFFRGDKSAITDALNQIYWRSMKVRG